MLLEIIIKGLIIGLSISVPLGPIGMLLIQRTLNRGQKYGLATGFGATMSDLIYVLVTLFFLSFVLDFIELHRFSIEVAGSVILILFGIWIYKNNPVNQPKPNDKIEYSLFQDFITSFGLTFSNPLILFVLIGLFARLNFISISTKYYETILGIASIVAGAGAWWLFLTYSVSHFRKRINIRGLKLINQVIGILIVLIGIAGGFYTVFYR